MESFPLRRYVSYTRAVMFFRTIPVRSRLGAPLPVNPSDVSCFWKTCRIYCFLSRVLPQASVKDESVV